MTGRRLIGAALLIVGIVVLLWGGVFWTDRDTLVDAGGINISTEERKGVALPPILGGACMLAGAVLLMLPRRTRV
jgi:drug/metabolite transporter (DMT)-like permease